MMIPATAPAQEIDGQTPHPVCGHYDYPDRHAPSGPCARCLAALDKEYAFRQPHPYCGCLKPVWSFRTDGGPCGQCLKDVEREHGLVPDPAVNKPKASIDDFRKWRAPLLEATDWVETNPARVAREPAAYVEALRDFRRKLLDGASTYDGGDMPVMPDRNGWDTSR
jgi:hypothetical protein